MYFLQPQSLVSHSFDIWSLQKFSFHVLYNLPSQVLHNHSQQRAARTKKPSNDTQLSPDDSNKHSPQLPRQDLGHRRSNSGMSTEFAINRQKSDATCKWPRKLICRPHDGRVADRPRTQLHSSIDGRVASTLIRGPCLQHAWFVFTGPTTPAHDRHGGPGVGVRLLPPLHMRVTPPQMTHLPPPGRGEASKCDKLASMFNSDDIDLGRSTPSLFCCDLCQNRNRNRFQWAIATRQNRTFQTKSCNCPRNKVSEISSRKLQFFGV